MEAWVTSLARVSARKLFLGYDGSTGKARSMSAEDAKSEEGSGGPSPENILAKSALEAISRHLDALFWDCSLRNGAHGRVI
jgi:hypothetical protein